MAVYKFIFNDGETISGTIIRKYKMADTHEVVYHIRDKRGDEWDIWDVAEIMLIENDPHYLAQEITILKSWEKQKGGGSGGMGI
jgi:hypothetical protein